MGCDIHLHVEIMVKGEWLHYNHPHLGRDYALFGKMAGVRGWSEPIAEPRGLPADATKTTRLDYQHYGTDAHTPSWLNMREIARLERWFTKENPDAYFEENWGYLFGNGFAGFLTTDDPDAYPQELEDVRFVFWFDN